MDGHVIPHLHGTQHSGRGLDVEVRQQQLVLCTEPVAMPTQMRPFGRHRRGASSTRHRQFKDNRKLRPRPLRYGRAGLLRNDLAQRNPDVGVPVGIQGSIHVVVHHPVATVHSLHG